jgi:hypothetical protein
MAITIDCGALPLAAVEADYSVALQATNDDGDTVSPTFESADLPDGLALDADGTITGNPTAAGSYTFTVLATGDDGGMGEAMCALEVAQKLDVDLDGALLAQQPFCLDTGESLLDFLVDGTGDGTAVACDHIGGSGNGRLPDGLTINPDNCTVDGNLAETRFGTYVFAMRGQQSGVSVYMPYCVTQSTANFAYDVSMVHSGEDPGTLVPIGRTFDPAAGLMVGEDGDPFFEIIHDPSCSNSSCFFGYSFAINSSPFDADTFNVTNRMLVNDAMDRPVGFSHGLSIGGPAVPEEFVNRPWVVNIELDYCLADNDMDCDGTDNIQANGDGELELGIIMVPQQG